MIIIDYGAGNIGSIINMLKKIGVPSKLSRRAEDIFNATHLILPGVGAFDHGMSCLEKSKLISPLNQAVFEKNTPILGICLGMQMLFEQSEEGELPGLGWISGSVIRFSKKQMVGANKIPHMGWNSVIPKNASPLFNGLEDEARFYFVHSYHVQCNNEKDIIGQTHYGYPFTSSVNKDNIYGAQFHPEKSHKFGMQLLKNFSEITCHA